LGLTSGAYLPLVTAIQESAAKKAIIREDQLKGSLQKVLKHAVCYHILRSNTKNWRYIDTDGKLPL